MRQRDTVQGMPGTEEMDRADVFAANCAVLVSAGVQNQIGTDEADRIRAEIVVEAANSPTTPEADAVLADRGICVVPDILCTAGGLVLAYFEWVQDLQAFFWSEDQIREELERIIDDAFASALATSEANGVDLRSAAMMAAVERVADATARRGLYP
jgi:glutamate dehydrogenase (NAD(P)+)